MSEIALLGLGKYQKEQSHEFWWTLSLFCRYGEWIHGGAGQKDPPPGGIGLKELLSLTKVATETIEQTLL